MAAAQTVTVAQTGGVKEIEVKKGMSIQAAIEAAGMRVGKGVTVHVNRQVVKKLDSPVEPGAIIMVSGNVSGGAAAQTVTVAQTGGVKEIEVKKGMSIQAAIEAAGMRVGKGVTVHVNRQVVKKLDSPVEPGAIIMVSGNVSGGAN